MIVDVRLMYDSGTITVRSEAADYSETRLAIITLSIENGETDEKIEAFGYSVDEMRSMMCHSRPVGSHSYRFVDPLAADSFEPAIATALVRHFCLLAHEHLKPARSFWRFAFHLDRFRVVLTLPGYKLVQEEKRIEFEKLLKRRIGEVIVEDRSPR